MNKLLLSMFFLLSPISISGISGLSIVSPYNLIGILLFFFLFVKKKLMSNYFILLFIVMVIMNLSINFHKSGLVFILSLIPIFYEDTLKLIKLTSIKKYIKWHFYILIIMLLIDILYRFKLDIFNIFMIIKSFVLMDKKINFYIYKDNTILFDDTNYVAIIIGTALLFYIHLEEIKILKNKYYKLILSIFLFFTFSRASYIALVITFIFRKYNKFEKKYIKMKKIIIFILIIFMLLLLPIIINYLLKDGSFKSKLFIIYQFYNYLKNIKLFSLIFGNGFSNSGEVLGIYAHNILIVVFIEGGILVFLSFIILFYYFWKKYKFQRDILIYNFLCLMSVTTYNFIYLLIVISTLKTLERINKN